jgi:hypothetical protein
LAHLELSGTAGSRAAGIAISRAGRHDEGDSPACDTTPYSGGRQRLRQPRQDTRSRQPWGKAARHVVRSCRRTSRAGHWLRLTVRARSGVLAGSRRLDPRHGRGWTGRKRAPVLRHLAAPDGGPIQAGASMVSNPPEMAVAHQPGLGHQVSLEAPAPPPGHAGSAPWRRSWMPERMLRLVFAPAA